MNQLSAERALLGGVALGVGIASVVYRFKNSHVDTASSTTTTTTSSASFQQGGNARIVKGKNSIPVCLVVIDMQKGFEDEKYWGGENNSRNNKECEQNILLLLNKWREKKWPIVHVRHHSLEKNSPLNPHTSFSSSSSTALTSTVSSSASAVASFSAGYEWKAGFEPQKDEIVIEKNVNSAFINTPLFSHLELLSFPPLVLCGLTSNHCVNTTARMAGNFGMEVFLPFDCTACFPRKSFFCSLHASQEHANSGNNSNNRGSKTSSPSPRSATYSSFSPTAVFSAQLVHEVALSNLHKEFCYVTSMKNILCWIDTHTWPLLPSLLAQEKEEEEKQHKEEIVVSLSASGSFSSPSLRPFSPSLRPSSPSLRPSSSSPHLPVSPSSASILRPSRRSSSPTSLRSSFSLVSRNSDEKSPSSSPVTNVSTASFTSISSTGASASQSARLTLLEHINLNIVDAKKAEGFYVDALGFRLNPKNTNERQVHVNMGMSQLHLLYKNSVIHKEPVKKAQVWKGRIELLTRTDLNELKERIEKVCIDNNEEEEENEATTIKQDKGEKSKENDISGNKVKVALINDGKCLRVVGLYGNTYLFHQAKEEEQQYTVVTQLSRFKGHVGGSAEVCGMLSATHFIRPGSAEKIARFYRDILGVSAQVLSLPSLSGESNGLFACKVEFFLPNKTEENGAEKNSDSSYKTNALSSQSLIFEENELAPVFNLYDQDETASYHICMYFNTHEAFELSLQQAAAHNLLYVNPRFQGGPPEFSSARSVEEGLVMNQYRVKDMFGGLVLEHEIRSPRHVACPLGPPA